jgi:hypothetical protein
MSEIHPQNIYTNSVRTSQETNYVSAVSATEPNRLTLFRETVAVCENRTEHINTLYEETVRVFEAIATGINANRSALKDWGRVSSDKPNANLYHKMQCSLGSPQRCLWSWGSQHTSQCSQTDLSRRERDRDGRRVGQHTRHSCMNKLVVFV